MFGRMVSESSQMMGTLIFDEDGTTSHSLDCCILYALTGHVMHELVM